MTGERRIEFRVMDSNARSLIRSQFAELEQDLGIDGIGTVLTTAVLELVENAVRANLKRAYFRRHGYDLDDRESYARGIEAFRQSYADIKDESYVTALRELELSVAVEVDRNRERLMIFVRNNALLAGTEEARIRRQLGRAMESDKFVDFYSDYGDETEGSGLGLAMIVFLIRTLGFNPENFRVFRLGPATIARLEFPMHTDYVPIRDRWRQMQEQPTG